MTDDSESFERARPQEPIKKPTVESTSDTKHRVDRPITPYRMTGDVPKTTSTRTESGGEPATTTYVKPRSARSAPPSQMTDDERKQALKRMMRRSEAKTKLAAESSTVSDGSKATTSIIDGERAKGYKGTNTEDDEGETEEVAKSYVGRKINQARYNTSEKQQTALKDVREKTAAKVRKEYTKNAERDQKKNQGQPNSGESPKPNVDWQKMSDEVSKRVEDWRVENFGTDQERKRRDSQKKIARDEERANAKVQKEEEKAQKKEEKIKGKTEASENKIKEGADSYFKNYRDTYIKEKEKAEKKEKRWTEWGGDDPNTEEKRVAERIEQAREKKKKKWVDDYTKQVIAHMRKFGGPNDVIDEDAIRKQAEGEWDKRAKAAEDGAKVDYAYKRLKERDAEKKAEQEKAEQAKADAQTAKDKQELGGGTNVDEDGVEGGTDEYADDEHDLGLYGGGVVSKKELDKIGGPSPWAILSSSVSSGLNYTESVASFVDLGLKSSRNVLNAMLNPSATGLKEMDATLTGTMRMLDGVSDFITKQTKSFDERTKWEAKEAENRMKTQFAYMVGKIGEGKDLTEFDQNDLNLLFDNMQRIWGRDVENLMKGKSPEVAAAIRKTNETLLKQIGNRARRLKGSALQDRRYAELDKNEMMRGGEKDKERIVQEWVNTQDKDTVALFNTLKEAGVPTVKAGLMMTNNMNEACNVAARRLEAQIAEVNNNEKVLSEDLEEAKKVGARYVELENKQNAGTITRDELDEMDDLDTKIVEIQARGESFINEKKALLDKVYSRSIELKEARDSNMASMKFKNLWDKYAPDVDEGDHLTTALFQRVSNSWGLRRNLEQYISEGHHPIITAAIDLLPERMRRNVVDQYNSGCGTYLTNILASGKVNGFIRTANWRMMNKRAFDTIGRLYGEDTGKSWVGDHGEYTQEFLDYVKTHTMTKTSSNGTKRYYFSDGVNKKWRIYPKDTVPNDRVMSVKAYPYLASEMRRGISKSDSIIDDYGMDTYDFYKSQMIVNMIDEDSAVKKLLATLKGKNFSSEVRIPGKYVNGSAGAWLDYLGKDYAMVTEGKTSLGDFNTDLNTCIAMIKKMDDQIRTRFMELSKDGENFLKDPELKRMCLDKRNLLDTLAQEKGVPSIYSNNAKLGKNGKLSGVGVNKPGMGDIMDVISGIAAQGIGMRSYAPQVSIKDKKEMIDAIVQARTAGKTDNDISKKIISDIAGGKDPMGAIKTFATYTQLHIDDYQNKSSAGEDLKKFFHARNEFAYMISELGKVTRKQPLTREAKNAIIAILQPLVVAITPGAGANQKQTNAQKARIEELQKMILNLR